MQKLYLGPVAFLLFLLQYCAFALSPHRGHHGEPAKFRLIHRDSRDSPYRRQYASMAHWLEEVHLSDLARLHAFRQTIQKNRAAAHASTMQGQLQQEAAKLDGFRSPVVPGASAGAGQYFVELYLGSPPKRFHLIIDTGSDLLWVRCATCRYNCKDEPVSGTTAFLTGQSSSYQPINCLSQECLLVPPAQHFSCNLRIPSSCHYDYVYADLSETSGILSLDTISVNMSSGSTNAGSVITIPAITFGCGLRNLGRSFTGSDGVMGLGRGSLSFPSQLSSVVGNQFSYCFVDFFRSPATSSFLLFGNNVAAASTAEALIRPFQYTPFLDNPFGESFYYVGVEYIRINEQPLHVPSDVWAIDASGNGGTVIDSGTTLSFLREPAYSLLVSAMRKALVYSIVTPPLPTFELCFDASGTDGRLSLPSLSVVLRGGAIFRPPPSNYFIDVTDRIKCLGFQGVSSPFGFSVLGNLLQQNFEVVYDRNKGQLGFAPAMCSSSS